MQNNFSKTLKRLRREKRLLQKDLSGILGVGINQIQNYEYGKQEPNIDKLIILAKTFNVSLDYLICGELPNQPDDPDKRKLNNNYDKLNSFGKEEANKRVSELTEMPKYIQPQTVKVACRGAGIQEIDLEIIKKLIQDAEKNKDKNIDDLF